MPESQNLKTLFQPVVAREKLHPDFERLRTWPGAEPARRMLDEIYQDFDDPEGNFLEQFQTTGFDARYFELYLFAYFSRSGFVVDRSHPNPDFLVSRDGLIVAVEATTVNPSTSGALSKPEKKIRELSPEELREYLQNELPIRFGSPLFSKLKKRYWELEHCRGIPLVLAIEAFHEDESLALSDYALSQYLFGLKQSGSWSPLGTLQIDNDWGYVVLARDQYFQFRAIELESSLPTRDQARMELQLKTAELLSFPQRIFPQLG